MNEEVRELLTWELDQERGRVRKERSMLEAAETNLVQARETLAKTEARIAAYEEALREAEAVVVAA